MAQLKVAVLKDKMKFDADVAKFMRQNNMEPKDEQAARHTVSKIDFTQAIDVSFMPNKAISAKAFWEIAHDVAQGREFRYEYLR